jgi:hypothetical protein
MPDPADDEYRPMSGWPTLRTVCHGCRQTTHVRLEGEDDMPVLRPMVVPGRGVVYTERSPGVMTEVPCPACGESETIGWSTGLQPPV